MPASGVATRVLRDGEKARVATSVEEEDVPRSEPSTANSAQPRPERRSPSSLRSDVNSTRERASTSARRQSKSHFDRERDFVERWHTAPTSHGQEVGEFARQHRAQVLPLAVGDVACSERAVDAPVRVERGPLDSRSRNRAQPTCGFDECAACYQESNHSTPARCRPRASR